MDLSIIIVNWNSTDYLRNCIASIMAETHSIKFEIIVIDNASFDGCDEMLREYYPQVCFIQSEKNIGFAKANNAAFRHSRGQHLLFLNPDTELVGPAISNMLNFLKKTEDAGAVGCKLLNADKTIQTSCIQAYPTILNQFLDSEYLRSVMPNSSLWGNAPLFRDRNFPEEVEAISGACMMMRRSAFEQVDLFSEDYFMFTEDVDLCHKINRAGNKIYYVPNATVLHYGSGSTKKKTENFSIMVMRDSRMRFLRKTRGDLYSFIYRVSTFVTAIVRIFILIIFLPLLITRKGIDSWKSSLRKWETIMSWSLGFKSPDTNKERKLY